MSINDPSALWPSSHLFLSLTNTATVVMLQMRGNHSLSYAVSPFPLSSLVLVLWCWNRASQQYISLIAVKERMMLLYQRMMWKVAADGAKASVRRESAFLLASRNLSRYRVNEALRFFIRPSQGVKRAPRKTSVCEWHTLRSAILPLSLRESLINFEFKFINWLKRSESQGASVRTPGERSERKKKGMDRDAQTIDFLIEVSPLQHSLESFFLYLVLQWWNGSDCKVRSHSLSFSFRLDFLVRSEEEREFNHALFNCITERCLPFFT